MKASRVILYATSGFLVVIWLSSFTISYVSLVDVATAGGITYPWVWLWPLLLDAFMTIASLDVIRRELNNEPTTIAWVVVIGVTLVSTGFNITRADPSVLSWAAHALAPVVCFLSFEIEMGVLRSHFRHRDSVSEMSEVDKPVVKPIVRKRNETEIPEIKPDTRKNVRNKIVTYYQEHPDAGYAEAAKELGVSRQVVRNYVMKLSLSQNTPGE
jgi:hypothetical protein